MGDYIVDDLESLVGALPRHIQAPLRDMENLESLLEVVLDLGRPPEARFPGLETGLASQEVTEEDILHVVESLAMTTGPA